MTRYWICIQIERVFWCSEEVILWICLFWNVSRCDHLFRCLPLEFWKCTKWKLHWSDLPFLLLRTSVPSKMWLHCIIPFQPVEVALRLMEIILKYQRWGNFFQLGEKIHNLEKIITGVFYWQNQYYDYPIQNIWSTFSRCIVHVKWSPSSRFYKTRSI